MDHSNALKSPTHPPKQTALGEVEHILLIDDDSVYRQLCQRYLARDTSARYKVATASSAMEGLQLCGEQTFDCILIDYALPDAPGPYVIQELFRIFGETRPPSIILTAEGGQSAAAEALRAGATDFLQKSVASTQSLGRAISNAVEKRKLRQSVEIRSRELQQANLELQFRNTEIQRFYQNVSHEVKTPLAAAREFVAIVRDGIAGPVSDEQKEMLTHALASCDQITAHFNDLIAMARLDAGKVTLNKTLGSIETVIVRSLASAAAAIDEKNLIVEKEISGPLPVFEFDCNRVVQVVSNLLGNAVKFTNQNGSIKLSVQFQPKDHHIEIVVSDTGCGMERAQLSRIFDRLYQIQDGTDGFAGPGLGLGLSIAKEIVTLHNGEIYAESIPGKGSKFTVRLPTNSCRSKPHSHDKQGVAI